MLNLEAKNSKFYEQHSFHFVNPSPWPLFTSLSLYCLVLSFVVYFHYYTRGFSFLIISLIFISFILFRWFEDIIIEATYEGHHTFKVQQNVLFGMLLFITSEIMFFFAFF
jgi:cytochrome c oxidase subunit 3